MEIGFKSAFEYKVIYVFTIESEVHKGFLKIGDTTLHTKTKIDLLTPNCRELNQAALKRIKAYTNTAGFTPKLLHTEIAIRTIIEDNGSIKLQAFRDYNVHNVLRNSGINNKKIGNTTGKEWFEIDLETAKKAIDAVKSNFSNLSNSDVVKYAPIIFRPEQTSAISKTVKHFKKSNKMLWNAKMRFGKTICALEVIKQCNFEKTIIITHRPVVNSGWYEDFNKVFYGKKDFIYGSKQNGYSVKDLIKSSNKFVYFASVQDLRGSTKVGGKHNKNDEIFDTQWDFVIVDEAHEGTTTTLGEDTLKSILKEETDTKFLALSGTPFNILADFEEESVYTWDYIMEQESKYEWDNLNFGDSNPYAELPELKIYTYNLGDVLSNKNYITYEDKAFNFSEFFRTWTGDINIDHGFLPDSAEIGDFVHEPDVISFLNLMTKEDEKSSYPYSTEEYRTLFKHSLWMVPGVKEARALKKLMLKHPIFGNGMFEIVNVAGSGDEEEKSEEALSKVRRAIKEAGQENYTITLSCGRLTTGVTVKEWTAVFMLAGAFSTSAANYLQTIFRVQSPCNIEGKIKETAYVFDFAPDRTLKMIANAVSISSKAGKTSGNDKQILGKFLNYCPVISITGSEMREYSANRLLQELKKAYADKVVQNGFDDTNLYNDELFKLNDVDIKKFDELRGIIGKSKSAPKQKDITVNDQGLTEEEYEEAEKLKKKPKKDLTPEEKARLEELKKMKKLRNDAITILRGISIRMPLLIYGANIPYDEEVTLERFVDVVDDSSWEEFMPNGVTKAKFKEFQKYYDEEVFIAAGRRIRNITKEADTLEPTERVKRIANLFSYFKNPDKETVLTPWRVVNMHMSNCLGGWCFWDESFSETLESPRWVDQGTVTKDLFENGDSKFLEMNSKTGLYPLYLVFSIYKFRCKQIEGKDLTLEKKMELWFETVAENIFVICKTPMAKAITRRTLVGYYDKKVNAHYFDDLINNMSNKSKLFLEKITRGSYWKREGEMKFDAVVGNPPYQLETGGAGRQAIPVYKTFVEQAKKIEPNYISMITPSRWFAGGMGLDSFRQEMMSDTSISKIIDYVNSKECFPYISISGGVNYFLIDASHQGQCEFTNIVNGTPNTTVRLLNEFPVLVRYNDAVGILRKVLAKKEASISEITSPLMPFGLSTNYRGKAYRETSEDLVLHASKESVTYISKNEISNGFELVDKYKVIISKTSAEHAGEPSKDGKFRVITSSMRVVGPGEVCTHSYFMIGSFDNFDEANNLLSYMKTDLARFLILLALSGINLSKLVLLFVPIQDFSEQWDNQKLYKKYDITLEEQKFIESLIKEF
ncbi:MAG: Eco57I restriction-modification methylase domain-containing protein [Solibacillus sp.]